MPRTGGYQILFDRRQATIAKRQDAHVRLNAAARRAVTEIELGCSIGEDVCDEAEREEDGDEAEIGQGLGQEWS